VPAGLALSGLYLRWPRRPLDWRTWLTFDPALKGRSSCGICTPWPARCLVVYVALTLTGIYWSYDVVRDNIDVGRQAAARRRRRQEGPAKENKEASAVDIGPAWTSFQQHAPGWTLASVRLPTRPDEAVQFTWLAADAPHERARSRMDILPADGKVTDNAPYSQQGLGARLVNIIYPLHMGAYFGLRDASSSPWPAGPALFAITGWMLYLGRRKASGPCRRSRPCWPARPATRARACPPSSPTPASRARPNAWP
jgi:sulfite reductase (NADPH) flavoprotein alpha-component